MDYSKFYTPSKIADILINLLDNINPVSAIDICCGSCNLLKAAQNRWTNLNLTGVDIHSCNVTDISFYCRDGREYAVESNKNKIFYDLVLANPPFERIEKTREFTELYSECFKEYYSSRLENEMLLANLALLNEKGILLIIMPSTFIEGDSNAKIRKLLGQNFYIKQIVKLPENAFGLSLIRSYAIYIKRKGLKCNETNYICLSDNKGTIVSSSINRLSQKQVSNGIWIENGLLGKDYGTIISAFRGKISSNMFEEKGTPVLHISKKSNKWSPSIRYIKVERKNLSIKAENGDIIISRIGKAAGCWTRYLGDTVLISDCLIVIKDTNGKVFNILKDRSLDHLVKGVATRYIALNDLKKWFTSILVN